MDKVNIFPKIEITDPQIRSIFAGLGRNSLNVGSINNYHSINYNMNTICSNGQNSNTPTNINNINITPDAGGNNICGIKRNQICNESHTHRMGTVAQKAALQVSNEQQMDLMQHFSNINNVDTSFASKAINYSKQLQANDEKMIMISSINAADSNATITGNNNDTSNASKLNTPNINELESAVLNRISLLEKRKKQLIDHFRKEFRKKLFCYCRDVLDYKYYALIKYLFENGSFEDIYRLEMECKATTLKISNTYDQHVKLLENNVNNLKHQILKKSGLPNQTTNTQTDATKTVKKNQFSSNFKANDKELGVYVKIEPIRSIANKNNEHNKANSLAAKTAVKRETLLFSETMRNDFDANVRNLAHLGNKKAFYNYGLPIPVLGAFETPSLNTASLKCENSDSIVSANQVINDSSTRTNVQTLGNTPNQNLFPILSKINNNNNNTNNTHANSSGIDSNNDDASLEKIQKHQIDESTSETIMTTLGNNNSNTNNTIARNGSKMDMNISNNIPCLGAINIQNVKSETATELTDANEVRFEREPIATPSNELIMYIMHNFDLKFSKIINNNDSRQEQSNFDAFGMESLHEIDFNINLQRSLEFLEPNNDNSNFKLPLLLPEYSDDNENEINWSDKSNSFGKQRYSYATQYTRIKTKDGKTNFKCLLCNGKILTSQSGIIKHIRKQHTTALEDVPISKTNKTRKVGIKKKKRTKTTEMASNWNENEKELQESSDSKQIAIKTSSLYTQIGDKKWKCKLCGLIITSKSGQFSHKTTHYELKRKNCPHCSKTFRNNTSLIRHIRCHTGEKPFKCKICEQKFRQRYALQLHQSTHTNYKPYKCKICGSTYTQSGSLRRHERYSHFNFMTSKKHDKN